MSNEPENRKSMSFGAGMAMWLIIGGGLALLLAWMTRFPWGWF